MKIAKLEEVVANARVLTRTNGRQQGDGFIYRSSEEPSQWNEFKYTLVSESEADLKAGKISVGSPIGKGLLGKEVGDLAEIHVPNGIMKLEVLEISADEFDQQDHSARNPPMRWPKTTSIMLFSIFGPCEREHIGGSQREADHLIDLSEAEHSALGPLRKRSLCP